MDSSDMFLMERGFNTSAQAQFNATEQQNATFALINNLVFAQSKSVRTSTIILAAFNILAAFLTAVSILYDCYWASKRCNPKFKASKFCISTMHPAETFPLILAVGIVVQGFIFAGVQGQGMETLLVRNCDVIGQFMWPALFIVPYIQMVFGVECAIRSIRSSPFQARGKYDVTICGAVIFVLLLGTWVLSFVFKMQRVCFASLMWFIARYGGLGVILLSISGGLMVISAITIFYRLSSVPMLDQHQRIAASRMVYYLVLGIMSLTLVLPYFVSQMVATKPTGDLKLSMIATVVVNLSGLMHGLVHLFLRVNTSSTSFGPKNSRHWNRGKHEIRIWGPNELVFANYIQDPVSGPRTPQELSSDEIRPESRKSLIGREKMSMDSLSSPPFRSPGSLPPSYPSMIKASTMPTIPEPSKGSSFLERRHTRKQSYSLFPNEGVKSPGRQNENPTSVYDITGLAPPPLITGGGYRHKRDSSVSSSATVQIGLRLSHAPEDTTRDSTQSVGPPPLPSTTYNPQKPTLSYSNFTLSPLTFSTAKPQPKAPSPLQILSTIESRTGTPDPPPRSPRRQQPPPVISTSFSKDGETSSSPVPLFNKDLPPTPRAELVPAAEALRVSNTKLTTAVYSPFGEQQQINTPINGLPINGVKCPKLVVSSAGSPSSKSPSSKSPFTPTKPQGQPQRKDWI